jgi:hypothetical protein
MKMAVFWVVAPCSLVEVYQRFRGRPDDGGSHLHQRNSPKLYVFSARSVSKAN